MIHESIEKSTVEPVILVITGSTRPSRLGLKIAAWVIGVAKKFSGVKYELVDLADWPLPMDDEPAIPQTGIYAHKHTQDWSRKIASADAIIFVTPQYNWGYPAPLKNALDHLYQEWTGKPVVIVSYGGHGGGKCAVQLRQVVEAMKMRPVATMPGITLSNEVIRGAPLEPENDFAAYVETVRQAVAELVVQLRPNVSD